MEMNLSDDFIGALNEKFKKILKKYKKYIINKKYNSRNRQKVNYLAKRYRDNNKQKIRGKKKIYYQTDRGKKLHRISNWKSSGLICDDYDALYEKVINTTHCEECNVLLTIDKDTTATTRCMDHDHVTGLFRNVLCLSCNVKRG